MQNRKIAVWGLACVSALLIAASQTQGQSEDLLPQEAAEQFLEAYNDHSADQIIKLLSPDVKVTSPDQTVITGLDQQDKFYRAWFKSVPDIKAKLVSLTVEDDRFVMELHESGTYQKALPTPGAQRARGQKLSYPYVIIGRVKAGKIIAIRIYENDLIVDKQLREG